MNRLFALLRRHSLPAAICAALLLAFAAPYLLPTDPDSAVFRSGTLALILLMGCVPTARRAFERHSPRALGCALAFALPFLVCLGLGSELAHYGQLLPGMGSLVRRVAVPLMAAPMLTALVSHVLTITAPEGSCARVPFLAYFALIAGCYALVLLAFYPGVVSYDFEHEIAQFTTGAYAAAHPVFHTLFLGSLYALGEALFGSMTAGAALYSAVQLLLLAAMYAYACCFVQRRVRSRIAAPALAACFAVLPFHGTLAVSTAKDPLFAGLCVLLCLALWEAWESPEALLARPAALVRFVLPCLGLSLLRHNAVFATVPACVALLCLCRDTRRRAALVCCGALALSFGVPKGLELAVGAERAPSSEMMSVPCQMLMRTAEQAPLSPEEYAEINAWFSNQTFRYRPHCADPAKGGNFDFARYQAEPEAYWSLFARYGARYPRIYLEAFLANCMGVWYPDDSSHANALSTEEYDYIYLNTVYSYAEERYPISAQSLLPKLQAWLYQSTHHAAHQKVLPLAILFCPASYGFLMLASALVARYRRQRGAALCLLPLWGLLLSVLFSAGVFVRYTYPLMAAAPVMALLLFGASPRPTPSDEGGH